MNNATVSDTEVSFAASLYEAFRRFKQRCCSFAMAELSRRFRRSVPHAWTSGMRVILAKGSNTIPKGGYVKSMISPSK
jgi:hypothetical protein